MFHDILGNIERSENGHGDGVATIEYDSRVIRIQIIPDDHAFETTLKLAVGVVERLNDLDKAAKRVIVAELRDRYNGGWNEYDQVQEDGSLKTVVNPQLSEDEFEGKFTLRAVRVSGSEVVSFSYDDSGLFWSHSVVVTSLTGTAFRDAQADLFG